MKKLNYLILFSLAIVFLTLASCGDDDGGPSAIETVKDNFSGTYVADQVTFESEDRTDSYTDFSITITGGSTDEDGGSYTTATVEELDPWPSSGSWEFTNPDAITDPNQSTFSVTRSDGVVIDVTLTDNQLTLQFPYNPDDHAEDDNRVKAVSGEWTFVLVPQN